MGMASQQAWEILERKKAYWSKALSNDAVFSNLFSTLEIFDWLTFFSDTVLSDTLFSSLISAVMFGISLDEIEPWNILYSIELPTTDEFLRGVLLKIVPKNILDVDPSLKDLFYLLVNSLKPDVAKTIYESQLTKGYYGVSKYGFSYYDPQAVRDFFRSTVYFMTKTPADIVTAKNRVDASADSLDIAPHVVEDLFNRLSMMTVIKEKTITFDYAWFDYSSFSGSTEETVEFISYNLAPEEVEYADLFDAIGGGWFDLSYFDYCFFTEEFEVYDHPWILDDITLRLRDIIYSDFRNRFTLTSYLVANYIPREEREEFKPSDRLEVFDEDTSHSLQIESLVNQLVSDLPPAQQNMYRVATKHLYSLRYGDNRRGLSMYKSMSEDEFKAWWIDYWVKQGLDPDILSRIYDAFKPAIDSLGVTRVRDKLRFIRSKLRSVS
ncbi:MAG: hypothetical protein C0179_00680 [Fervidicoccus sp.]|nr:MAG: hypothetical protein C0179_00680 [Fervidicoccus sp.]